MKGKEFYKNTCLAKVSSSPIIKEADLLISVDESLVPPYESDDILAIRSQSVVKEGEVGAYLINGKPHIKIRGKGELLSLNDVVKPVPLGPNVECIGKVIGVLKAADVNFDIG